MSRKDSDLDAGWDRVQKFYDPDQEGYYQEAIPELWAASIPEKQTHSQK